ncbi:AzlC family ABC transporter permease [Glycomyces dulcitolivorans]|jgi:4-azaleucine resistance transporter AzlC|uniref:AzlC family ABC transporter permease n=1 Tax=Glycomyces dulcitolivorans TaxID=2200759 RepID=UPI000DD439D7|nr:AzlC family ABC transporter permease [Glycomyces dulcitolivorans]
MPIAFFERHGFRGLDRKLLRDIAALAAGILIVGISFGAIATSQGVPWWQSSAMSLFVYAGAAQFATMGIMTAGGGLVAGVAAGLILNLRHIPYGMAVGGIYWTGLRSKLIGTHLLIDQSTAFALAAGDDPRRARQAFWTVGVSLFLVWNVGTVIGAFAGQLVADPKVLGLDAALPAILLALVMPSLKDRRTLLAGVLGTAVALATSFFLPAGIPVLLAVIGVVVMGKGTGKKEETA